MKSYTFYGLLLPYLLLQCLNGRAEPISKEDVTMPALIVQKINEYRLSRGLSSLKMDPAIAFEAQKHSMDMATHRLKFGHAYFNDRIKHLYAQLPHCRGGAENVAYNYKNAAHVVREWIKSPGHRRNIVGAYNLTGVGIARDAKGKIYFTQMFIRN